jgi:O-antigen/teichoic acid export membrane protein
MPIAVTFALLGDVFVGLWMGPEFMNSAAEVLLVLGLLQIVSAPHYVVSSVMYGMSQHHAIGYLRIGEAAVKLTLSIFLVQKYGIVGAAIGTAIPHAILTMLLLPSLICGKLEMSVSRYFVGIYGKLSLATVPFVAGALLMKQYWPAGNLLVFFMQIGLLCCIYAASVFALALDKEERNMILKMLPKRKSSDAT